MSPFHLRPREQPQASTSAQHPVPTPSRPPTPALPAHAGPSGGLSANDEALADAQAIALDMVQTIASVMSNIADTFPIPGLKIGLLALVEVIKKIQVRGRCFVRWTRARFSCTDHADKCGGRRGASGTPALPYSQHR